jgi:hypothetical protein
MTSIFVKIKNILVMQKSNYINSPLRLAPVYFKKIGLALIVLTVLFSLFFKQMHWLITPTKKEILKYIIKDFFLIGLGCIAFSRDKIEDELTMAIRMKSMVAAFTMILTCIILWPFLNLLFNDPMKDIQANQMAFQMLFFYLGWYYSLKYLSFK